MYATLFLAWGNRKNRSHDDLQTPKFQFGRFTLTMRPNRLLKSIKNKLKSYLCSNRLWTFWIKFFSPKFWTEFYTNSYEKDELWKESFYKMFRIWFLILIWFLPDSFTKNLYFLCHLLCLCQLRRLEASMAKRSTFKTGWSR